MAVCESRHSSSEDVVLRRMVPEGYCCLDVARKVNDDKVIKGIAPVGGGVAVVVRESMKPTIIELVHGLKTFEYICISCFPTKFKRVLLLNIYRPGSQQVTNCFYTEIQLIFEGLEMQHGHIIITGDLNIHFEDETNSHAMRLLTLMDAFGYKQHVMSSTHVLEGTLDVIITKENGIIKLLTFSHQHCRIMGWY
ncbi:hypothetical protein HELRODRAFT_173902 [Helobdella robusta]|uniref:Endonuclease/exonuclease/phosphatase domain-containing protein n=1 Tax=Helobdella robusta TaxID=6412 RepID=T1F7C4_HELRO|nr:hypothetical protein HELRODRAFT_173902 [Helobdella robusta]ESO03036.1 hypothetical protein HELRODRAFT_173902 [Helobdella robusta]